MIRFPFFILLLLSYFSAYSQPLSEKLKGKEDVKVGLVLSGGGAKGFAHIGALKILEEANVRIDYIGGTSMGAIVGAMYATGYSAQELDSIFETLNFEEIINDQIPRRARNIYKRRNNDLYALTLPFNNLKVGIPASYSQGRNIYNKYVKLLYPVNEISDFSKLPIPFLCVVTDVENGKMKILEKGYLPQAIAASGSFPSLFSPVEIDGHYYTDGGVTNNYPIDEIKAKEMDIIIGIDVQDSLFSIKDMDSALKVLFQVSKFSMRKNMLGKPEKTDVYIQPSLKGYGVVSFNDGRKIIDKGEQATQEYIESLREIAKHQKSKRKRTKIHSKDTISIKNIEFHGNENYSRDYLLGKLKLLGKNKVSFKELEQGITNLAATDHFKSVTYKIEIEADNLCKLQFNIEEKPDRSFIKFGIHYDKLYETGFLLNLTKHKLFQKDDVASLDVILGDNIRYKLDYFVDKGFYTSYGFSSKFSQFEYGMDSKIVENLMNSPIKNINKVNISFYEWINQIYFQTMSTNDFLIGFGLEHKNIKITTQTIQSEKDKKSYFEKSHFLSTYGYLITDTFNDRYYPTNGFYLKMDTHFYFANKSLFNNFNKFIITQIRQGFAFSLNEKVALTAYTSLGFKIGNNNIRSLDFAFGGFGNNFMNNYKSFLGYDYLSFGGNSFISTELRLDYQFITNHHFLLEANFANVGDNLYGTGNWLRYPPIHKGFSLGYGWNSFVGPVEIRAAWSPEVNTPMINFNLGFWF